MSLSWAVSHLKKNDTPCSMTPTWIAARQALEKDATRFRIKTEVTGKCSPSVRIINKTFLKNTVRNVSGTNRTMEEKNYEKWAVLQRKKNREFATSSSRTSHRDRSSSRARREVKEVAAASKIDMEYHSGEERDISRLKCGVEKDESRQERSRIREDDEVLKVVKSSNGSTARRDRSRSRERTKFDEDTSKSDVVEYHSKRARAKSLEDEDQLSAPRRDRSRSRERIKLNQNLATPKAGVVELFSKRARARSKLDEVDELPKHELRSNTTHDEELEIDQSSTHSSSSHRDRSISRDQTKTEMIAFKGDEEQYRLPGEQEGDASLLSRSRKREDKENVERKKKKKDRKDKKSERRAAAKDYADGGSSEKKRRRKHECDNERAAVELESDPPRPEVLDEFGSSAAEHIEGFKSLSSRGIRSEKRAMLNDSGPARNAGCAPKVDADVAIFGGVPESAGRPQERWGNDGFFALEAAKAAAEEQRRLNRIKQKEARSTQLDEEQALRKRALDQLAAGGPASRKAQAVEAPAEEDGARQRRRGPDASRLSFETQDRGGESGEEE